MYTHGSQFDEHFDDENEWYKSSEDLLGEATDEFDEKRALETNHNCRDGCEPEADPHAERDVLEANRVTQLQRCESKTQIIFFFRNRNVLAIYS